ncbi:MAG TPA: hypothetical protein VF855_13320 [Acidimicrobiales bacterium]
MAAPEYVPVSPTQLVRGYESPDHVPSSWVADRPGELAGRQPSGGRLGYQGPDQGFGLLLANRFRDRLQLQAGENTDDVVHGCLNVALRRASMFGRAPVVHDFTVAFTIWGFLDPSPPADLVELRRRLFEGLRHTVHHYDEGRTVAEMVPEATLRFTPQHVEASYPAQWKDLVGA